jgi:hypothetical protein
VGLTLQSANAVAAEDLIVVEEPPPTLGVGQNLVGGAITVQ